MSRFYRPSGIRSNPSNWTDQDGRTGDSLAADGFRIERDDNDNAGFGEVDTVDPDVASFADETPRPNETLSTYRVVAFNQAGESASNTADVRTTPDAPGDLVATTIDNDSIGLEWQDFAQAEDGFELEMDSGSGFVVIDAAVPEDTETYTVTGLDPEKTYRFRLRSFNENGYSPYSNTASAVTAALPTAPAAPSGLSANWISDTRIDLSWTDNSGDETGFQVRRAIDDGSAFGPFSTIFTTAANVTSYSDTTVAADNRYRYHVRATNAAGDSTRSNNVDVSTTPDAPTGLVAVVQSSTSISLSWTDNSLAAELSQVERKVGAGSFVFVTTVAGTTFVDDELTPGTLYTYRVRDTSGDRQSAYSNESAVTTPASATYDQTVTGFQSGGFTVPAG
ncbi:MAG: fibronectin type III domain-containing protein, partial [Chloroflexi bacterium]|nr:fibronectin type III domain-containing protein [Chloroflexota bacterium]